VLEHCLHQVVFAIDLLKGECTVRMIHPIHLFLIPVLLAQIFVSSSRPLYPLLHRERNPRGIRNRSRIGSVNPLFLRSQFISL
jgi:hypothetical protein